MATAEDAASPGTAEYTVIILRGDASSPSGPRHAIEARLASTGFSIIAEQLVELSEEEYAAATAGGSEVLGCKAGRNLCSLLERPRRAVQVLRELVGPDIDGLPASAGSLRALYGKDVWAPATVEEVIELLEALWPELAPPKHEFEGNEEGVDQPGTPTEERRVFTYDDSPSKPSSSVRRMLGCEPTPPPSLSPPVTGSSCHNGGATATSSFRARPLPDTTAHPTSSPRLSKAAALRLGIPWSPPERTPPSPCGTQTPEDYFTPGVKRRPLDILPASLAPPPIAPRQTKASALRAGVEPPRVTTQRAKRADSETFADTPGHKWRRASLQAPLASTAPPAVAVRATRASSLREGGLEPAVTTKTQRRQSVDTALRGLRFEDVPGYKRSGRIEVAATRSPEVAVRQTRASTLRVAKDVEAVTAAATSGSPKAATSSRPGMARAMTAMGVIGESIEEDDPAALNKMYELPAGPRETINTSLRGLGYDNVPGYKRSTKFVVKATAPPEMAVRQTKASQLRAVKETADGVAAGGQGMTRAKTSMGMTRGVLEDEKEEDAEAREMKRAQTFQGVPGHKRAAPITVASTRAPTIAPRLNRAAALRNGRGPSPPSAVLSRTSTKSSLEAPTPPRTTSRSPSTFSQRTNELDTTSSTTTTTERRSSLPVAPSIAPRTNRAAALRAAQGGTAQTSAARLTRLKGAPTSADKRRSITPIRNPTASATLGNVPTQVDYDGGRDRASSNGTAETNTSAASPPPLDSRVHIASF